VVSIAIMLVILFQVRSAMLRSAMLCRAI